MTAQIVGLLTLPWRVLGGVMLDTIFGPAEEFENVPLTTPSSPPPRD